MPDSTTRKQAYFFACLAAIATIGGAVGSYEYRELKEAYHAEQARSSALAATPPSNAIKKTLAIRNNNPLNVKSIQGRPWFGQIAVDKHGHAVFDTPEHGIRAGANVLLNYYTRHNLDTLDGILSRFCTGNREEYAAFLSKRLGIRTNKKFDVLARLPELLQAMARFESGQEWPRELFTGYSLVATAYRKGQR